MKRSLFFSALFIVVASVLGYSPKLWAPMGPHWNKKDLEERKTTPSEAKSTLEKKHTHNHPHNSVDSSVGPHPIRGW
jgi:hypothetical protein